MGDRVKLSESWGGEILSAADMPATLAEALGRAAKSNHTEKLIFVQSDGSERRHSYDWLLVEAKRICAGLHAAGLQPADKVILQLEQNDDILTAFWGCVLCGVIPVLTPVPSTYERSNRLFDQLVHIAGVLENPTIITSAALRPALASTADSLAANAIRVVCLDELRAYPPDCAPCPSSADDPAFFSLTSGSTSMPKCVVLTHRNVLARAVGANQLGCHSAGDVVLNWLPFDHIGSLSDWHLRCVLLACQAVYAPMPYVLANPLRWLALIEKYCVSHSWAPNFAYHLLNDLLSKATAFPWDLSSIKGLLTAGEAVSAKVTGRFTELLKPCGLAPTVMRPAFGMAEMASGVTYYLGDDKDPIRVHRAKRSSLAGSLEPAAEDDPDAVTFVSLGPPIPGVRLRIVDANGNVVPEETVGQFQVQGDVVARGYYRSPEASRAFHEDGWFETGDLGFLSRGELYLTGRAKESIIVNGVNFGCGEIEELVNEVDGVEPGFSAACAVRVNNSGEHFAVFFHTERGADAEQAALVRQIRGHVARRMGIKPDYLVPVSKESIPKTAAGKLQRAQLSRRFEAGEFDAIVQRLALLEGRATDSIAEPEGENPAQHGTTNEDVERRLTAIWKEVLNLSRVGRHDNVFELGGNSLLLTQLHGRIVEAFGPRLSVVDMFKCPTIASLSQLLAAPADSAAPAIPALRGRQRAEARKQRQAAGRDSGVAVVGLACRLPGAANPAEFWHNLAAGVESITFFTEAEVLAAGIDPALARNPNYVRAAPVLERVEQFDADFFGYTTREAELLDPQQRVLLECAWEAMEDAGYDLRRHPGAVGVFVSGVLNTYLLNYLWPSGAYLEGDASRVMTLSSTGGFQVMIANDKDYLPTRISYKLNLRGPSVNVQTACSSSLVAIHMAAQSVLAGECEMAFAGGASISLPQETGYLYQDGLLVSPDGHCRAFDADAQGTIFGNGAGLVLLKRLDDAVADGDHIYAVIKGSALNNDGGEKAGYLAPSQDGQAAVVAESLAAAGVSAESISYVEAHGTATALGDPIEIAGLTQAFRADTDLRQFCAVGSVKTNVGHLQIASGVAGFIKTVLALDHRQLVPSLHFRTPNPRIDLNSSPFYVNTQLQDWPQGDGPRRASVNSLGIGGANVHVILEESPQLPRPTNAVDRPKHLLTLSAKTPQALRDLAGRWASSVGWPSDATLGDVCFTANAGRAHLPERLVLVADGWPRMVETLQRFRDGHALPREMLAGLADGVRPQVAFLFTGQGSHYFGMAQELYDASPSFRHWIGQCDQILRSWSPESLAEILYADPEKGKRLHDTRWAQPALFAVEYALGRLWMSWGLTPSMMLGHSLGQYVAACLAEVFSLEDALRLVVHRARLMDLAREPGKMVAIEAAEDRVAAAITRHDRDVSIAAVNSPNQTVISGSSAAVEQVVAALRAAGLACRDLAVSHAFHSPLIEPVVEQFREVAAGVTYSQPKMAMVSLLAAGEDIASPDYWCRHLRETVQFQQGVTAAVERGCDVFLEVGPEPTLLALAQQCLGESPTANACVWLPSLRRGRSAWDTMLSSLAALYVRGAEVDWQGFDRDYARRRQCLPTYPFQRKRYWIERPSDDRFRNAPGRPAVEANHSLLGRRVVSPALKQSVFESLVGLEALPILDDHRFCDTPVLPGAFQLVMVFEAIDRLGLSPGFAIEDVAFSEVLASPEGAERTAQLIFHDGNLAHPDEASRSFQLVSRPSEQADGDSWTVHTTGQIVPARDAADHIPPHVRRAYARLLDQPQRVVARQAFYAAMQEHAVRLGPSFQAVDTAWVDQNEVLCRIQLPDGLARRNQSVFHAVLLDACAQIFGGVEPYPADRTRLPTAVKRVRFFECPEAEHWWCYAQVAPRDPAAPERITLDAWLFATDGRVIATFTSLQLDEIPRAVLLQVLGKEAEADWVYRPVWVAEPRPVDTLTHRPSPAGTWLIFADQSGIGARLAALFREQGEQCSLVWPGDQFQCEESGSYRLDPAIPEHFQKLLDATRNTSAGGNCAAIYLWGLDQPADPQFVTDSRSSCAGLLNLVQALGRAGSADSLPLCIVTRGAQTVGPHPRTLNVWQSPLWGFGRTIGLEYPEMNCLRVDLDPEQGDEQATLLLEELRRDRREPEIALRGAARYVARLERRPLNQNAVVHVRPDATYLITGGTGGLGLHMATWLVERGARHLVLASRHGAVSQAARREVEEWQRRGVNVVVATADVAQEVELASVLSRMRSEMPPLAGIVAAAGIRDDGLLQDLSWARFQRVVETKALGTWNLHHLTKNLPLDFFLSFSSIAAVLGSPGQANYAAANAFLDGLMQQRHAQGLPGLAINWGLWHDVGMAATLSQADQQALARRGLMPLEPAAALRVLPALIQSGAAQLVAAEIDWRRYISETNGSAVSLAGALIRPEDEPFNGEGEFRQRLALTPEQGRQRLLFEHVRELVGSLLGVESAATIEPDRGFRSLGLDSLAALMLRNRLQSSLGLSLSATVAFKFSTIQSLVDHLAEAMGLASAPVVDQPMAEEKETDERLALEQLSLPELAGRLTEKLAAIRRSHSDA